MPLDPILCVSRLPPQGFETAWNASAAAKPPLTSPMALALWARLAAAASSASASGQLRVEPVMAGQCAEADRCVGLAHGSGDCVCVLP